MRATGIGRHRIVNGIGMELNSGPWRDFRISIDGMAIALSIAGSFFYSSVNLTIGLVARLLTVTCIKYAVAESFCSIYGIAFKSISSSKMLGVLTQLSSWYSKSAASYVNAHHTTTRAHTDLRSCFIVRFYSYLFEWIKGGGRTCEHNETIYSTTMSNEILMAILMFGLKEILIYLNVLTGAVALLFIGAIADGVMQGEPLSRGARVWMEKTYLCKYFTSERWKIMVCFCMAKHSDWQRAHCTSTSKKLA